MRTFKPISTITYVSNEFLESQLNALVNVGDVEFWAYINHKKESETLKDHTHLFIQPIPKLETRDLQFKENEIMGTIPYKKSDFGNWYFYSVHNKLYLESKKIEKKYSYSITDFKASDQQAFIGWVGLLEIEDYLSSSTLVYKTIREAAKRKIPFDSLVESGEIPINQINNYETAYNKCRSVYARKEAEKEAELMKEFHAIDIETGEFK